MPIERITPGAAINAYIEQRIQEEEERIVRKLEYIGEAALRIARDANDGSARGSYTDRTGNLRNSTGYIVALDGRIRKRAGFDKDDGAALAETIAKSYRSGAVLVVVAGMHYAKYVAARGFDVLDSAEITAKRLATQLLNHAGNE